ncbi:AraC family transcriptional regulator [Microbacterium sp. NPDC077644]|uniref:helix-turn-helix transcriptional regulator n=1 Tax=Microbacterium sp. NPDC077644 TaxID=3155055 RepID=UPI00344EED6D
MNTEDGDTGVVSETGTISVRTKSLDEAMSVGGVVFHAHTLAALDARRPPRLSLSSYRRGAMTLGSIQYSAGAHVVTGSIWDSYQINVPLRGEVRTERDGQAIIASASRAAVYGLHQHEFSGFDAPTQMIGVKFERTAVERRLEQLLGHELAKPHIEFELGFDLTTARGLEWLAMIRLLTRPLRAVESLASQSMVQTHLQDAALNGLLIAARHDHSEELNEPAGSAGPRAVNFVIDLIRSSPDAALLTVPELAERAGVGVRALQAGFRRQYGTTPLSYLIARRLDHAHEELHNSEPGSVTVGEVANRWGFYHHGRFATSYRNQFGVAPSTTLSA